MAPIVEVNLTNGFGNNLFQYIYARLIAEHHDAILSIVAPENYYGTTELEKFGFFIKKMSARWFFKKKIKVNDENASSDLYNESYCNYNFVLNGYFEDYQLYKNHVKKIKTWFPVLDKKNNEDLVLHLRLGDRLFYKQTYLPGSIVLPDVFLDAINKFEFKNLYIVTDMHSWQPLTVELIKNEKWHTGGIGGCDIKHKDFCITNFQMAINYFNSIYDVLNKFFPIVRCNCDISDDFNFIRSFDKILFQHSTTAWWAAILSEATQVGVYGKWRPWKNEKNQKLSNVDLAGWFHWG